MITTNSVLLVEDDPNDVFFFRRAMNKAGINNRVQVARDGQEAIDYLNGANGFADRAAFPLPDLILLDLKLPFVMGLDVLKWIRQQSDLPAIVVILSSSQESPDIAAAYRLGANGYLVKPADLSQLDATVRAINDYWFKQNIPPPVSPVGWLTPSNLGGPRSAPANNCPGRVPAGMSRREV